MPNDIRLMPAINNLSILSSDTLLGFISKVISASSDTNLSLIESNICLIDSVEARDGVPPPK